MKFRSNKLLGVYRSEPYIVQRIEGYLILPARLWWRNVFGCGAAIRILYRQRKTNRYLSILRFPG